MFKKLIFLSFSLFFIFCGKQEPINKKQSHLSRFVDPTGQRLLYAVATQESVPGTMPPKPAYCTYEYAVGAGMERRLNTHGFLADQMIHELKYMPTGVNLALDVIHGPVAYSGTVREFLDKQRSDFIKIIAKKNLEKRFDGFKDVFGFRANFEKNSFRIIAFLLGMTTRTYYGLKNNETVGNIILMGSLGSIFPGLDLAIDWLISHSRFQYLNNQMDEIKVTTPRYLRYTRRFEFITPKTQIECPESSGIPIDLKG